MDTYINLEVWKTSRQLVKLIYEFTFKFPSIEKLGLSNQMQRCSVSIPSNIAEGCGRQHSKDSIQFFFMARGSVYELETQLYLSDNLNYLNEEELNSGLEKVAKSKKLINGFIKYYKTKSEKQLPSLDNQQPTTNN